MLSIYPRNIAYIFMQISRFQRSWGMDPSFMPSRRSFERAGWLRYSPQFWFYCLQQQTIGLLTFKSSKERWMKVVTSQLMAVTLSHSQFEVSTWWNFPTGRFDIARALEKWGGLRQVSRLLSLKVRRQRSRQDNLAKDKKVDDDVASPDVDSEIKTPSRPTVSQDPQNWLTELKQLDINWVE